MLHTRIYQYQLLVICRCDLVELSYSFHCLDIAAAAPRTSIEMADNQPSIIENFSYTTVSEAIVDNVAVPAGIDAQVPSSA